MSVNVQDTITPASAIPANNVIYWNIIGFPTGGTVMTVGNTLDDISLINATGTLISRNSMAGCDAARSGPVVAALQCGCHDDRRRRRPHARGAAGAGSSTAISRSAIVPMSRIVVAMSGGVESSVAAALLRVAGP